MWLERRPLTRTPTKKPAVYNNQRPPRATQPCNRAALTALDSQPPLYSQVLGPSLQPEKYTKAPSPVLSLCAPTAAVTLAGTAPVEANSSLGNNLSLEEQLILCQRSHIAQGVEAALPLQAPLEDGCSLLPQLPGCPNSPEFLSSLCSHVLSQFRSNVLFPQNTSH